jgi:hypothetical protein
MMKKIEQLRKKPDHVKRMIAASVAGGITLVIIVFWVASLSVSSGSDSAVDASSADIAASPFTTLSASVADAVAPIGTAFERLYNAIVGISASSSNAIVMYAPASSSPTTGSGNMDMVGQSNTQN